MLALATGSAAVTVAIAGSHAVIGTGVAVAQGAPVVLPAPMVAHTTPAPVPVSNGAPVRAANGCINVPMLYYHYIRINPTARDRLGYQLSVTPQNFQMQMDWLRAAGAHTVTLAQVMSALNGGPELLSHPVVLTFDDGYADFATAATPILVRDGFVGTDFVVPGFLGTSDYMTKDQVLDVASQGMVIGAHTMHHVKLTSVPSQVAAAEISSSKAALEQLLGVTVDDFAYPFGAASPAVESMVQAAGFRDASATTWGTEQCTGNRFALHRLEVVGGLGLAAFAQAAGVTAPPPRWVDPGPPTA
ncbi:MAG: polysaccharide deacetylase family protein [Candidatus Dormibacteria bacterium]